MAVLEGLKELANLARKLDNVELTRQIIELQQEVMDLMAENQSLRQQLSDAQQRRDTGEQLAVRDNAYWNLATEDGPFCTNCWDADEKLIRLHRVGDALQCPKCEKYAKRPSVQFRVSRG